MATEKDNTHVHALKRTTMLPTQDSMPISCEYISVACNRTPKSLQWCPSSNIVTYGAGRSIAVADFASPSPQVEYSLHGHTGRVSCVHFIRNRSLGRDNNDSVELVSGASDNTIRIWKKTSDKPFEATHSLVGHQGSVRAIAATHLVGGGDGCHDNKSTILVSASADSTLRTWLRESAEADFRMCQRLSFGRGFALGLDLYLLEGKYPLLACGRDDATVSLYLWRNCEFAEVLRISGHENWIMDVKFVQTDGGSLLLASASQDGSVRLWSISPQKKDKDKIQREEDNPGSENLGHKKEEGKVVVEEEVEGNYDELQVKKNTFSVVWGEEEEAVYSVSLEAVLTGHEDCVYSVDWRPGVDEGNGFSQSMCLLTASMDKTMIVWKPDLETGIWTELVRVGEVGGNTLGLYGGVFSANGDRILAHGYQGAFHMWREPTKGSSKWQHQVPLSGHFGPVVDISWDPRGNFFLSVSLDQTCRLHAPWVRDEDRKVTWHEVARPQVHGYDMQCVSMTTSGLFVSGADEKVLRVFGAPRNFVENLSSISRVQLPTAPGNTGPLGASIPALGLSNKAVFTDTASVSKRPAEGEPVKNLFSDSQLPHFVPMALTEPPVEETLLQNTLWPEVQKLYGHGFELYAVDSSPKGDLVASACKAAKQDHAGIRLWDASSWKEISVLTHHSLTITQLAFSRHGNRLLAVSRDRCWSLWKLSNGKESEEAFQLEACVDKSHKSHSRIIWTCSWAGDDSCFFTGSRDRKVFVWTDGKSSIDGAKDCGGGWKMAAEPLTCAEAVTAVSVAPVAMDDGSNLVAIGLENGHILLYLFALATGKWLPFGEIERIYGHSECVKRLQWQPVGVSRANELKSRVILLASCSVGGSVLLTSVQL